MTEETLQIILFLLVFLFIGLLLLCMLLTASMVYQVTHPPRLTAGSAAARGWWIDPSDAGLEFDDWSFDFDGYQSVPVWEIDHPTEPDGPVLLMTHGWGESRIASLQRLPSFLVHVGRVALWDLPGHGEWPKKSRCLLGHGEDRLTREATNRAAGDRRRFLYGHGMGVRLAAIAAADDQHVDGLILENPTVSYADDIDLLCRAFGVPAFPIRPLIVAACGLLYPSLNRQNLLATIGLLSCPVLVLAGDSTSERDERLRMSRDVADAAASAEYVEYDRSDDLMTLLSAGDPSVEPVIRDFVSACVARSQQHRRRRPAVESECEETGPVLT